MILLIRMIGAGRAGRSLSGRLACVPSNTSRWGYSEGAALASSQVRQCPHFHEAARL